MRRLFANAHYDFISNRRKAYMFSGIVLAAGLAAALFFAASRGSWLNYGVDFTGGSLVQVIVDGENRTIGDVRNVVTTAVPGSVVSRIGDQNEFIIRTPPATADAASGPAEAVVAGLRSSYGAESVQVGRSEAVGAKVGGELQTRALLAILISFAATLVYLAFRFEWRFGVASVIATVHDILLTLSFLALLQLEVSLPTVAAFLTIVGYSLNDTIIIFDRIRENLRTAKRQDFVAVLNRSINETLPRTVLTTATTIVTLLALFLFGGGVIREFALIMIMGILLGTYSSIFVAAPALRLIEEKFPHQQKQVRKARTPVTSRV
ncbi:MAG TPA: protein translocase subunit SecF [Longimicrobiales bacterium]|nr:protein translocase subunit SecF [Longimicrobiales bacterium]